MKIVLTLLLLVSVGKLALAYSDNKQKSSTNKLSYEKLIEQKLILNSGSYIEETPKPNNISKTLKGRLTLGHEVSSFIPCGSDNNFWIFETVELANLYAKLTKNKKPYTSIFVRIEIIDKGKAEDAFATSYDSTYEVVKILEAREVSDKDCE